MNPCSESHLDQTSLRAKGPSLIGTALYGAVCRVVWDRGANYSPGPDPPLVLLDDSLPCLSQRKILSAGISASHPEGMLCKVAIRWDCGREQQKLIVAANSGDNKLLAVREAAT
jgi:hypothetical protein